MKFLVPAALAAVASLCPAALQAQDRETVTVRVSRAGLNLSDADQRAVFDKRVRHAAYRACTFHNSKLVPPGDAARCVREMRVDGSRQVAMIVDRQQRQLAAR